MKKGLAIILFMALGLVFTTGAAWAMPHFSRKVAKDCTFCHSVFPKLNENGRIFRSNGYRFAEDMEKWAIEAKDITMFPLSAEVEIELEHNQDTPLVGSTNTESELKLDEVELLFASAMGKTGKISALGVIAVEQDGDAYETVIGPAYVQINDLIGDVGKGTLNLRAGQWAIALPFIGPDQQVVMNRYLAARTLGVFSDGEQRAVELNGSIVAPEETSTPTHRYSIGLSREDVINDHKLQGYYLTYAATVRENYNLGVIYRSTEEAIDGNSDGDFTDAFDFDASFEKFGIAGEASFGTIKLSLGYFVSNGKDGMSDLKNYLIEALYLLDKKITLGARYDVVDENISNDKAKAATLSVRYNILSNVFAQAEYRRLTDDDGVVGSNEKETRGRLVMVAMF
ncbi:MAG: porin [Thermodesulfobacteriota bacterium]